MFDKTSKKDMRYQVTQSQINIKVKKSIKSKQSLISEIFRQFRRKNGLKPIIVDGENISRFCSPNKKPLINNIIITVLKLLKLGWKPIIIVSARFWREIDNKGLFYDLVKYGIIKPSPASRHDDHYILTIARSLNAPIVSNDKYGEFLPDYKDVIKRRITFMIVEGEFISIDL